MTDPKRVSLTFDKADELETIILGDDPLFEQSNECTSLTEQRMAMFAAHVTVTSKYIWLSTEC